jgi:catechol 2,3-dioxygenase-like lactoylglutathione lyase family enzyme
MEQRVSIFTVRVDDLEATTRFYVEGLGWQPFLAVPGEVTFLQVAPGVAVSLFDASGFDADAGQPLSMPFNLAHNVDSEDAVRDAVADMVAAGGRVVLEPQPATWGGFHAFVADPNDGCWEIAYNPDWRVAEDGTITLGAGED